MKKFMENSWHRKLGNEEYAKLYLEICYTVEELSKSEEITNPHYLEAFQNATDQLKFIEMIKVKTRGHELTKMLLELNQSRLQPMRTIFRLVDAGINAPRGTLKDSALILNNKLSKFGKSWLNGSQDVVSQRLMQIIDEFDSDQEVLDALEDSAIMYFYDMMKTSNAQYENIRLQRTITWSGRDMSNIDSDELRTMTWKYMNAFLRTLDSLVLWRGIDEFEHTVAAIKKVMSRSHSILLRRITMKANGEEEKGNDGDKTPMSVVAFNNVKPMKSEEFLPNWMKEVLDDEEDTAAQMSKVIAIDDEKIEDVDSTENNPLAGETSEEEIGESYDEIA